MHEDAGPAVKNKASTRFIEKNAKLPHGKGLGKLSCSIA
jgi:hypothetical protein